MTLAGRYEALQPTAGEPQRHRTTAVNDFNVFLLPARGASSGIARKTSSTVLSTASTLYTTSRSIGNVRCVPVGGKEIPNVLVSSFFTSTAALPPTLPPPLTAASAIRRALLTSPYHTLRCPPRQPLRQVFPLAFKFSYVTASPSPLAHYRLTLYHNHACLLLLAVYTTPRSHALRFCPSPNFAALCPIDTALK